MKFSPLEIPEIISIDPDYFRDDRGHFFEAYHKKKYLEMGIREEFVQHNQSRSIKNVLRGLHFQIKHPQGKLVRVLAGEAFDVAVDIRVGSPTFQKWIGVTLSAENGRQLYIPPGFAHGFLALTDGVEFEYKCTDFYDNTDEGGILWNDPELAIRWPVSNPILSQKDKAASSLSGIMNKLPRYSSFPRKRPTPL